MAKPVNIGRASDVASRFFPGVDLQVVEMENIYVFSPVSGQGFVLVAADDCVRPVLAYSYSGRFDAQNMPPHVAAWIDGYNREVASLVAAGIAPSAEVQALWENTLSRKSDVSVDPLLTTRWAQRPYYNLYCPYDSVDSAYSVTGCVATAMAQIMRYWQYPETGWNSHSYIHPNYGVLSADFGSTHYRWNQMPDTLNVLCDSLEIDAVATLMYQAGVSVNMSYSPRGSGAYSLSEGGLGNPCAENAMKTYFRYNPMLYGLNKSFFSDAEWHSMLYDELDAARPVFYTGADFAAGGHAFVLDGYDTLGMFHVNWGWGGYYDGFYTIDSLSPGAGSLGGEPIYNTALFDVYPAPTSTDTVVTINFVSNRPECGSVVGSGTYHLYDTVTILPQASQGCRYLHMSTGWCNVPVTFLAVHDISDTVFFDYIEGDTVGYCYSTPVQSWRDDYGTTTEWGIRIPPVMRHARQLTAVQLYYLVEGDHTLNIYLGDSINGATPVYSGVYSLSGEAGWRLLELDSVLTFNRSQILWITISQTETNVSYPLACDSYCGNSDGSWYHLPDGWQTYDRQGVYYTWMIRAVFDSREWYNVAASPNDINAGDVMGMGPYAPGDVVTLHALPHNGYQFSYWSNGSTDNPLDFIITCDTTFIAFFEPITGIEDIESSELKIEISGLTLTVTLPAGIPSASLYDIQGRELSRLTSHVSQFTLPVVGIYLLKSVGCPARKIVITK